MEIRTSDLLVNVQPAHTFNEEALLVYARANVQGFPPSPSKFAVSQFGHGQSNLTFLLEVGSGATGACYVFRKKPPGKLLESAHPIEREFQVLKALTPVPKGLLPVHGHQCYWNCFLYYGIFGWTDIHGSQATRLRACQQWDPFRKLASHSL